MQKIVELSNSSHSDSKCLNYNIATTYMKFTPNLNPENLLLGKSYVTLYVLVRSAKKRDQNCNCISLDSQNCNEIGENLFLLATISGNSRVVEYLLNQNFDVDATDYLGKTSLHYAGNRGYLNIVLLTMERQANVSMKDNKKNTTLHYTV
ncbi:hypothetical protein JTB14_030504 [Gonioctena quinquepunctata]|nr:hypothetical protein JTB14_030504 [Gonioctena quinquepunctata]